MTYKATPENMIVEVLMDTVATMIAESIGEDEEKVKNKGTFYSRKQFKKTRGNNLKECIVFEYLGEQYSVNVFEVLKNTNVIEETRSKYPDFGDAYLNASDETLHKLADKISYDLCLQKEHSCKSRLK